MIAVAVVTHNRAHLLRQCIENVVFRASPAIREIVVWDNASSDETRDYLDSIKDPRFTVVHHPENICQSGFARAFALTSSDYLVTLGDDIIDAPARWDEMLLDAFRRLPNIGFLAADFVDDEHDECAHLRYRVRPHMYVPFEQNGVRLLRGPAGSGCAITSREVYERAGGFRQHPKGKFFSMDGAYTADIAEVGYEPAVLADLKVHHAGGPFYTRPSERKLESIESNLRRAVRKNAIKRLLLRIPLVTPLNESHRWFSPPEVEMWWQEYLEWEAGRYREALASPAGEPNASEITSLVDSDH
jgi:GT2 family glycosyltransferase